MQIRGRVGSRRRQHGGTDCRIVPLRAQTETAAPPGAWRFTPHITLIYYLTWRDVAIASITELLDSVHGRPAAPCGTKRTMTDDEYLEFVEQFLALFPDREVRRRLEINVALL